MTTTTSALAIVIAALGKLTVAELGTLRDEIDRRTRTAFRRGDLVTFKNRQGLDCVMRVDRVNDKSLGGIQQGGDRPGLRWRVDPSFCRLVGADKPVVTSPSGHLRLAEVSGPDLVRTAPIGPAARLPEELRPGFGAF